MKFFKNFLMALCLTVTVTSTPLKGDEPNFDDLSIIVFSCDKYHELWPSFFKLLDRHWPSLRTSQKNTPIYLVANKEKYDDPRVTMINITDEKSWSDNAKTALAQVKTKYVLVLLEDYFFQEFNEKRLAEIYAVMKKRGAAYVQLALSFYSPDVREKSKLAPGIALKGQNELWRTSLQPCIWRVKEFRHILKSGDNAWEFERSGSERSEGLFDEFLCVYDDLPMTFLNMVQEGHLNSQRIAVLEKQGVVIKNTLLKVDSDHKFYWWWRSFIHDLYWNILDPIKNYIIGLVRSI